MYFPYSLHIILSLNNLWYIVANRKIDNLDRRSKLFFPILLRRFIGHICKGDSIEPRETLMKTLLHSIGGHGYIRPNGLEARNKASRRAYFTFLSRHHQCLSPSHLSTQRYGKTNLRKIRNEHQEEESIWDYKCTSAQGRASLGSQPQASEEFITTLLTYPERWERVTVKKQKRMKWSSQDFFFFLCFPGENHPQRQKSYLNSTSNALHFEIRHKTISWY